MSPSVHCITELNFDAEVLASPLPFLLDFGAVWCPPCRALLPIVARIAEEGAGKWAVGTVDADESSSLAARLGVRGLPTIVVFAGGKEVARRLGFSNRERLLELLAAAARAMNEPRASAEQADAARSKTPGASQGAQVQAR